VMGSAVAGRGADDATWRTAGSARRLIEDLVRHTRAAFDAIRRVVGCMVRVR